VETTPYPVLILKNDQSQFADVKDFISRFAACMWKAWTAARELK
jgi:hypothetical protein